MHNESLMLYGTYKDPNLLFSLCNVIRLPLKELPVQAVFTLRIEVETILTTIFATVLGKIGVCFRLIKRNF